VSVTFLSESWMQSYLQDVTRLTAQRVGVPDPEWKSPIELLAELDGSHPAVTQKLRHFFNIYQQWFYDSKDFNEKLLAGTLTQEDKDRALTRMFARDEARQQLLEEVKHAQQ